MKREKLGDLIDPIKETFELLIPQTDNRNKKIITLRDVAVDYKFLEYSPNFEAQKELLESELARKVLGRCKVEKLEELDKNEVEDIFNFGKGIKELSLAKEKQERDSTYDLKIVFSDGLTIESFGYPKFDYRLGKYFEIDPKTPIQHILMYEINPNHILVRSHLSEEQIPFEILYSLYLQKEKEWSPEFPETIKSSAKAEIEGKLKKRYEKMLAELYKDLQKEMDNIGGDDEGWFKVKMSHYPVPKNEIEGEIYFGPFISSDSTHLKEVRLANVLSKFNKIEKYVRNIYNKTDFSKTTEEFLKSIYAFYYTQYKV